MKSKTNWHRHRERQRNPHYFPFKLRTAFWVYHSGPYFTKKKKNPEPRLEFLIKTTTEPSLITTPLSTPHYPIHISHQNPQKSSHRTKKIPIIWVHNACESELEVEESRWGREREREKRLLDQKKNQLPLCSPKKLLVFVFSDQLYQQRKMLSFCLSLSLSL